LPIQALPIQALPIQALPIAAGRSAPTELPHGASRQIGRIVIGLPSLHNTAPTRPVNIGSGSMLTRRAIMLGAICAAAAGPASAADPSPQTFVAGIYDAYKGKNGNGHPLDNERTIRRYFEPSLAAALLKDQRAAARRQEVGTLDFDPFVDAQDWEIDAFDIAVSDAGPDKATATVKFSNLKRDSTVVLDLVKIKGEWKISDITWTPHETPNSLRALLAHH
jgi:hypothetical protein